MKELNRTLAVPAGLEQAGVNREAFSEGFAELVENCLKGSTRVNPVPVFKEEMAEILWYLYEGV